MDDTSLDDTPLRYVSHYMLRVLLHAVPHYMLCV